MRTKRVKGYRSEWPVLEEFCYYLIWLEREAPSVGEKFSGVRYTLSVSNTDELNRGKSDKDIEK